MQGVRWRPRRAPRHLYSPEASMNTTKVLVGGLAAGVVLVAWDVITQVLLLGDRFAAELEVAMGPGAAERMQTGGAIATFVVMDLILGLALVWLYAAIRPRFGPGMTTAVYAAIFAWLLASVIYVSFVVAGLTTVGTFALAAVIWLIGVIVAAGVGGRLYTEEDAPVTARM
jgi:hypothetical protein